MSRIFFIASFTILFAYNVFAQSGATFYSGVFYSTSPDKIMTPSGTSQSGYNFGVNIRLNNDPMYFLFTGEYGSFNLIADSNINFTSGKNITYTKGKAGLGFDLAKLGKRTTLRTKFQGNILVLDKIPERRSPSDAPLDNKYEVLNEAIGGLSTGLGLTYGMIDIDIEYEHGLYNIYYGKHKSTMNTVTFTAGFRI